MVTFALAAWTLLKREIVRFWRQKSRVMGVVASPLLFWLIVGFGSGETGPAFFFPGTVTLTVMFSAIFSTISIIEDRREGFLLSMLVSPAPRSSLVIGKVLGSATLAWIQGVILLVFAPLAGVQLTLTGSLAIAGIVYLVAFCLSALGFLIAWKFDSTQGYHAVMNLLLLPMWLVSGSIFSIGSAHGWVRSIMWVNPLTYAQGTLRRLMTPDLAASEPAINISLIVLLAFAVALVIGSVAMARRPAAQVSA